MFRTIVLLGTLACTAEPSVDASTGETGVPAAPGDTIAPRVISTTPEDGAEVVRTGVDVVIRFSEPMHRASVEGALTSDATGLQWGDGGAALTLELPLAYAEAPAQALPYAVTLSTDATDLAGNPLEEPLELTFHTGVRHVVELPLHESLFGNRFESNPDTRYSWLGAGDGSTGTLLWGVASWYIEGLPVDVVDFERVTLSGALARVDGDPAGDFGPMLVERVAFDTFAGGFSAVAIGRNPTPLIADGVPIVQGDPVEADLTPIFADAFDDGAGLFQIRVGFEGAPNDDEGQDAAFMSLASAHLTVETLTR